MTATPQRVLVIDIGGSHVKLLATGQHRPIKIISGPTMTPAKMVAGVRAATAHWEYDVVSIGYPGPVVADAPMAEFCASQTRLGRVRICRGLRAPGEDPERRRHAGARRLSRRPHALLGLGTGLGSSAGHRRTSATAGIGAPTVPEEKDLRRVRRRSESRAARSGSLAAVRDRRRETAQDGDADRSPPHRRRKRAAHAKPAQAPSQGNAPRRQRRCLSRRNAPLVVARRASGGGERGATLAATSPGPGTTRI